MLRHVHARPCNGLYICMLQLLMLSLERHAKEMFGNKLPVNWTLLHAIATHRRTKHIVMQKWACKVALDTITHTSTALASARNLWYHSHCKVVTYSCSSGIFAHYKICTKFNVALSWCMQNCSGSGCSQHKRHPASVLRTALSVDCLAWTVHTVRYLPERA